VPSRTLVHDLRFGLAQRPRQRGRPNWRGVPGALARAVTMSTTVTVARSARARRQRRWGGGGGASTGATWGIRLARWWPAKLTGESGPRLGGGGTSVFRLRRWLRWFRAVLARSCSRRRKRESEARLHCRGKHGGATVSEKGKKTAAAAVNPAASVDGVDEKQGGLHAGRGNGEKGARGGSRRLLKGAVVVWSSGGGASGAIKVATRRWAAGNGLSSTHAGGRHMGAETREDGEADGWGPGNSAW
jgi:hypothetical protein